MYTELLSSSRPGLIVILIDQSLSMSDPYADTTKASFAALALDRVMSQIIAACTLGEQVRDRCYVAVIGYGVTVQPILLKKASELAAHSDYHPDLKKRIPDGAGGTVEVDEVLRCFVPAKANGGTPMAEAFREAYQCINKFIAQFPDSFPPIVINITDGEPNDMSAAVTEASNLAKLQTSDGNIIIMNAHISNASAGKVELPSTNAGFSSNTFANFLFNISTVLPENLVSKAKAVGFNAETGSKGFVFNADAETLIRLLNFGSLGALTSGPLR